MATATPPKTTRETWSDIAPEYHDLVTMDELLAFLSRAHGCENVTADTIRYWQKIDVLPQPVKRWHDGATRALYPREAAFMAIIEILDLQERGYTLRQIGPRLRRRFAVWNIRTDDPSDWRETAMRMAAEFAEITGNTIRHVQITFIDEDDERDTFSYPVGSDDIER